MRILGLPGREPSTCQPMTDLLALVARAGDRTEVQRYGFWAGDFTNPDVEPEAARAARSGGDLVIGWSIGALVAMTAREDYALKATAWVFIGAPLKRLAAEGRSSLLRRQAACERTLFIQQTADPTGTFEELMAVLPPDAECREVAGGDHAYGDAPKLAALISAWLLR
jgi:predicted alpha/beta-hydrolase family hydrolase